MPLDVSSPSSTYEPPLDAPDPYSTPQTFSALPTTLPPTIDASLLPHGLPLLGPLTGYTPTRLTRTINARYGSLSAILKRPLTTPEQEALAWHTSKGVAISSYGPSIGVGAGVYRTWATMEGMRWPFYGKLVAEEGKVGVWDGEKVRLGGREILKNVDVGRKRNFLHAARGSAYVTLGVCIVPMLVSAYGATVSAVGELRDERLKGLTRELRQVGLEGMRERAAKRADVTGQGQRTAGELWKGHREEVEKRGGGEESDDASPSGGAGYDFGEDKSRESERLGGKSGKGDVMGDGEIRAPEERVQAEPGQGMGGPRRGTFQKEKVEKQSANFGDDYDDASPTGGMGAVGDGVGGGSVWDRIRSDAANGPTAESSIGARRHSKMNDMQQGQRESSGNSDSFSFSSSEGDKSYARDEAQKEFDERVEKERQGGDFGGADRSGRRW